MAIRQEEYTIYIKPYIISRLGQNDVKIYLDKNADLYTDDPTIANGSNTERHKKLTKKDGEEYWGSFFSSNSLEQVRIKYKKLLEDIGEEYIKVEKNIPIDILIKPFS